MKSVLCTVAIFLLLVSGASATISYAAVGDPVQVEQMIPNGTCWYFPQTGTGNLYDLPSAAYGRSWCILPGEITKDMKPGIYTLLYEEPVMINGKVFRDVSFRNNTLYSMLSGTDPIDESGMQAKKIETDFRNLVAQGKLNTIKEHQIEIQEPILTVTDLRSTPSLFKARAGFTELGADISILTAKPNFYRLSGRSNFANNTLITVKIDEERYRAQHNDSFTYTTRLVRAGNTRDSEWAVDMYLPVNDMPGGWHDITVYGRELITTVRMKTDTQDIAKPTPTVFIHYLSNGDIAPVIVTVPVPGPTQYIDRWLTATPTPAITDALGDVVSYPYAPGKIIPQEFGIIGLLVIAGIVLFRGWKWK